MLEVLIRCRPLIRLIHLIGLSCWLSSLCVAPVLADEPPLAAANPEIESRMMALSVELRCLVCQNQTIADSHAGLAEDLRQQIRKMLAKGMSERQILDYMAERYGDFVLYRPPINDTTLLLWAGPVLLMAGALGSLLVVLRRRQQLAASAFDPETPDEDAPR